MRSFDTLYYEICAFADEHIQCTAVPVLFSQHKQSEENFKLVQPPLLKISLPLFYGIIKLWKKFYHQFKFLDHDNSLFIEKFHCLLSCVSGSSQSFVGSLLLSEQNYPIVWHSLRKKYQNKRIIGSCLLDTFST